MHLHSHRNKIMPLMKHFIIANFNNGIKFHNCTYWSTNDIQSHHFVRQVTNHHINNKDLVFSKHVKIAL
jgi:hypothetical protein